MARAYTYNNIVEKKYKILYWDANFIKAFAQPETTGIFWIGGHSSNGKTAFIMQLIKELASLGLGRVLLNALEEGTRLTLKENLIKYGLGSVKGNVLYTNEDYTELCARLDKKRAPWCIVIDSVQLFKMSPAQFAKFREKYAEKHLLIFISHMDGLEARGKTAKDIWQMADLKILVDGFIATSGGRFNVGGQFKIWEQGAADHGTER